MTVSHKIVTKLCHKLSRKYSYSNLGNKKNPLNELLYIIISLRTTSPSLERTYRKFKKAFPKWRDAYKSRANKIAKALKNAGLSKQKAHNLKLILGKIKKDLNELSLKKISPLNDRCLEEYLLSLPGVGLKSARCIMMYSFMRKVFPVDSHCFRIMKRLGWLDLRNKYTVNTQNYIQSQIPPKHRYKLHVNLIQHGRQICFPYRPRCQTCFLSKECEHCKATKQKRG